MKRAKTLMTGSLAAASFVARDRDLVGANVDPQLTIAAGSVTVAIFTSASVSAATYNTLAAPQYVSRDENVATVNALGAVTGVAVGRAERGRSYRSAVVRTQAPAIGANLVVQSAHRLLFREAPQPPRGKSNDQPS